MFNETCPVYLKLLLLYGPAQRPAMFIGGLIVCAYASFAHFLQKQFLQLHVGCNSIICFDCKYELENETMGMRPSKIKGI